MTDSRTSSFSKRSGHRAIGMQSMGVSIPQVGEYSVPGLAIGGAAGQLNLVLPGRSADAGEKVPPCTRRGKL